MSDTECPMRSGNNPVIAATIMGELVILPCIGPVIS